MKILNCSFSIKSFSLAEDYQESDRSWDSGRKLASSMKWKRLKSDPIKHKEYNEKRKARNLRYYQKLKMKRQAMQAQQLSLDFNMDENVNLETRQHEHAT